MPRLTNLVEQWIEDAFEQQGAEDGVVWDLAPINTDKGPALLIAAFMPGAVLGTQVSVSLILENPATMTVDDPPVFVADIIEALRNARSQQLPPLQSVLDGPTG